MDPDLKGPRCREHSFPHAYIEVCTVEREIFMLKIFRVKNFVALKFHMTLCENLPTVINFR